MTPKQCAILRSVSLINVEAVCTRGIYDVIKSSWICSQMLLWMVEKQGKNIVLVTAA